MVWMALVFAYWLIPSADLEPADPLGSDRD